MGSVSETFPEMEAGRDELALGGESHALECWDDETSFQLFNFDGSIPRRALLSFWRF